jgi:adenosine deaminase
MKMQNLTQFIEEIPKAELHVHIEGTLEAELMFKLAQRNQIQLPYQSITEVEQAYQFDNLQSFLDIYYAGAAVLQTQQDFYDLTWAYLEKANSQNIRHTEIFFDPQTHTMRGIAFDIVYGGIHQALEKAHQQFGITSHLILCFLRHLSAEAAMEMLEMALSYKENIIAVGLDSSELDNPPSKFKAVFDRARSEGFLTVAHAGEEGSSDYIWQAIKLLKVARIDHGVQCLQDPQLVDYLVQNKIPLTVCPLSNVKLKVFPTMAEHNLKKLLDLGICVTINSDDPAYFGGYITENYQATHAALNFNKAEIYTIAKNSFEAAFLTSKQRSQYLQELDNFMKSYYS